MAMSGRLGGKVALVTGAGSGIGRETAIRFAQEGASVVAADLRGVSAYETAEEIAGDAFGIEIDVTSAASAQAGVAAVVERLGGLDVVVNNAGVTIVGAVHEISEDDWDRELFLLGV